VKRRAFTLVELLVVVAVIVLLIAILLPELSAARSLARDALCRGNLRQVGAGFELVASQGRYQKDRTAAMRYPQPERWPTIPYNCVPQEQLFLCPEDDPQNWSLIDGLKYRSYWRSSVYWLDFRDGDTAPNGQVCCRGRRGEDENGSYWEFVFEENYDYPDGCNFWDARPWYPGGNDYSDNDGRFIIWDDYPGRGRVLRLDYFTCTYDLGGFLFDEGLFESSGTLQGHAGEEVELGAFYTSYGINAKTHRISVAPDTIVLMDYEAAEHDVSFVADPDSSRINSRLDVSGRHRGKINALFADQSVRHVWPAEIYPAVNYDTWSPELGAGR